MAVPALSTDARSTDAPLADASPASSASSPISAPIASPTASSTESPIASVPTACIQPGSFLTLHYRLSGPGGDIINTFNGPAATLTLGTGELSPAVEERLIGLEEGAHGTFEIPAGQAFGDRAPDRMQWVARKLLDQMGAPGTVYEVGEVVQFPTPDGLSTYAGSVQQVNTDSDGNANAVLFDFNHPLAGQSVTFEVDVIGVL